MRWPVYPRDVVLALGFITWADGDRERGVASAIVARHLLGALLDHERVGRVLLANPFRSAPIRYLKRSRRVEWSDFPDDARATSYQPLRIRRREPLRLGAAERSYRAYDRKLRRAAAELVNPAVITTSPLVAGLSPLEWAGRVTYYARDDYAAARAFGQERNRELFEAAYGSIRTRGRAVAAVSQPILEQIDPAGMATVVPNAIDPERWRAPALPHPALANLPHPRILYVGGLDERLDVPILRRLSAAFEQGSIALVGPLLNPGHLEPLRECRNVHFLQPVDRSDVPALTAAADVGILPHSGDRGTRGMSPLKLYEYLAGGLPAVATDLPAVRDVDERVAIAREGEAFERAVARALETGRAGEPSRRAFIDANGWQERHNRLIDFALGKPATLAAEPTEAVLT